MSVAATASAAAPVPAMGPSMAPATSFEATSAVSPTYASPPPRVLVTAPTLEATPKPVPAPAPAPGPAAAPGTLTAAEMVEMNTAVPMPAPAASPYRYVAGESAPPPAPPVNTNPHAVIREDLIREFGAQNQLCIHQTNCKAMVQNCATWTSTTCSNQAHSCEAVLGPPVWPGNNCTNNPEGGPPAWPFHFGMNPTQQAQYNWCARRRRPDRSSVVPCSQGG